MVDLGGGGGKRETTSSKKRKTAKVITKFAENRSAGLSLSSKALQVNPLAAALNRITSVVTISNFTYGFTDPTMEKAFERFQAAKLILSHKMIFSFLLILSLCLEIAELAIFREYASIVKSPFFWTIILSLACLGTVMIPVKHVSHFQTGWEIRKFLVLCMICKWMVLTGVFYEQSAIYSAYICSILVGMVVMNYSHVISIFSWLVSTALLYAFRNRLNESQYLTLTFAAIISLGLGGLSSRFNDYLQRENFTQYLMLKKNHIPLELRIHGRKAPTPDTSRDRMTRESGTDKEETLDILILHSKVDDREPDEDMRVAAHLVKEIRRKSQKKHLEFKITRLCVNAKPNHLTQAIDSCAVVCVVLSKSNVEDKKMKGNVHYAYEKDKPMVTIAIGDVPPETFSSGMKMMLRRSVVVQLPELIENKGHVKEAIRAIFQMWSRTSAARTLRRRERSHSEKKSDVDGTNVQKYVRRSSIAAPASNPALTLLPRDDAKEALGAEARHSKSSPERSEKRGSLSRKSLTPGDRKSDHAELNDSDDIVDLVVDVDEDLNSGVIRAGQTFFASTARPTEEESCVPVADASGIAKRRQTLASHYSVRSPSSGLQGSYPRMSVIAAASVSSDRFLKTIVSNPHLAHRPSLSMELKKSEELGSKTMVSGIEIEDFQDRDEFVQVLKEPVVESLQFNPWSLKFWAKIVETSYSNYIEDSVQQSSSIAALLSFFSFISLSIPASLSIGSHEDTVYTIIRFICPIIFSSLIAVVTKLQSIRIKWSRKIVIALFIMGCLILVILPLGFSFDSEGPLKPSQIVQFNPILISLVCSMMFKLTFVETLWQVSIVSSLMMLFAFARQQVSLGVAVLIDSLWVFYLTREIELNQRSKFLLGQRLAWENIKVDLVPAWDPPNSETDAPAESLGVFISYSHSDAKFANNLEKRLKKQHFTVWIDKKGIKAGENWREEVAQGIDSSAVVVFIISHKSVKSKYCIEELEYAYDNRKPILPVILQDSFSVMPEAVKLLISHIQWINFEKNSFDAAFKQLLEAIDRTALRAIPRLSAAALSNSSPTHLEIKSPAKRKISDMA